MELALILLCLQAGVIAAQGLLKRTYSVLNNPKHMVPTWPETEARLLVTRFLKSFIATGCIIPLEEGGTMFTFEGTEKKCSLKVYLRVHSPQFHWKVETQGDLGLADAFIHGDFSSVDKNNGLLNLFMIFVNNRDLKASVTRSSKRRNGRFLIEKVSHQQTKYAQLRFQQAGLQEREYVFEKRALAPFAASVLVKAWKESVDSCDVEVILAGLGYLNDQICWLKQEAPKWHITLTSVVLDHKPLLDYFRFFERLTRSPDVKYADAVTILWAVESVYHNGFVHCLEEGNNTPEEMKEGCKIWGNENIKQYCQSLENIANKKLEEASNEQVSKNEVLILDFLENIVRYWNTNLGET
ncbi:putative bifunctional TENA-E protein [Capsicum chinense]|nr:putative bifunctional TENA-E protein [Capsicum chinense]